MLFTGIVKGQIVNIPDVNFKNRLINTLCVDIDADYDPDQDADTNNDGEIQVSEALAVSSLYVENAEISDLTGIEYFTNLTLLNCSYNQIASLDVSPLTNLTFIDCSLNQLTSLDVSSLVNLTSLAVSRNQLSNLNLGTLSNITRLTCGANLNLQSLDVSNFTNLQTLECNDNALTNLNLSNNNNLDYLKCNGNQLTQLDISNLTQLQYLNYGNNNLPNLDFSNSPLISVLLLDGTGTTDLDVSSLNSLFNLSCSFNNMTTFNITNTSIQALNCYGNLFSTLDTSACTNLTTLRCGSNFLRNLFIKNGQNETFWLSTSPNLELICADESQFDNISLQLVSSGSANATITSYCSFTPGGSYNTITGNLLYDLSGAGCDGNSITNPYIKININNGTNVGSTFSNIAGNYAFFTQTGNFTVTPEVENPSYFNISPSNAVINFPLLSNSTETQSFCISANGFHPDLEVVLTPIGLARPGFDANYKIVYKNKGNQLLNGIVNLIFDDVRTDFVSSIPAVDNQQTGFLTLNFTNLHPFETRTIDLVLNLNAPFENPPLNSGDILHFTATTSSAIGEGTLLDNTFELNQNVVNSADPNDKTCLEGNTITPEDIGKYVHYNINFENVGTADAVNVVIKDLIDTTKFDVNTLQLLYASHPVETKIDGNKVEFIFENINLPPSTINPIGGHGNVLFKIKTLPTLLVGDQIANIANIYFDYNAPIETNEARSTFAVLNNSNFVKDQSISIAPNPAKNSVTVTAISNIKSIELFDVQGRILQTILEDKNTTTIDISNKSNGIYFLKVTTENGSSVEKLVKEN